MAVRVRIEVETPFDLALSLKAVSGFAPGTLTEDSEELFVPARIGGRGVVVRISQIAASVLEAESSRSVAPDDLKAKCRWIVNSDLELAPFYRVARREEILAGITRNLKGCKPLRPQSVFDMAVIAITEQQISMAAAAAIRGRIVKKFGENVDGFDLFPSPESLARARIDTLKACGLSGAKADYIHGLARSIVSGEVDLEGTAGLSDGAAREVIGKIRGFGRWSVEYVLVRGLGRPDAVPSDDLGVRRTIGAYYAGGRTLSAAEVDKILEQFAPFRGLAVFYLIVYSRLRTNPACC